VERTLSEIVDDCLEIPAIMNVCKALPGQIKTSRLDIVEGQAFFVEAYADNQKAREQAIEVAKNGNSRRQSQLSDVYLVFDSQGEVLGPSLE